MLGEYLREHGAKIVHVRFPFFNSQTASIWVEHWDGKKKLSRRRSLVRFYKPELLSFMKDFMWVMTVGWWEVRGADIVICTNNLMGFAGLILRSLGIVKRVNYMMIDYTPQRFGNPVVEKIYRILDRLVTTKADAVWPISVTMLDGRVKAGYVRYDEVKKIVEAPMGTYSHIVFANGAPAYDKRHLVYVGNASGKNVRADVMVDVAGELRDRGEKFKMTFVGGGSTTHLQARVAELKLENHVEFIPPIPGIIDLERYLATCGLGLAPYDPYLKDNFSKFADPGKIKNYLGCALPVISTTVPPIAEELEQTGAGKVADLTPKDFADKIMAYWNDDAGYVRARKEALRLGERYTWPAIFDKMMEQEGLQKAPSAGA